MTSKSEGKIGAKQRDSVAAQPEAARTVQLALPIHFLSDRRAAALG